MATIAIQTNQDREMIHSLLNRHTLVWRLILSFLVISLLPLSALTGFSLYYFKTELTTMVLDNLDAIARKKSDQIENYVNEMRKDVRTLGRSHEISQQFEQLQDNYYTKGIQSADYQNSAIKIEHTLMESADNLEYYDILLLNTAGEVIFSMRKEKDFTSNLRTGVYHNTALAEGFVQTLDFLTTEFSKFELYAPSNNQPAAFIITPLFKKDLPIGILAVQVSLYHFHEVITDRTGLGTTGETVTAQREPNLTLYTSPLRHITNAAFHYQVSPEKTAKLMLNALNGGHGNSFIKDYANYDAIASSYYLPSLRWGMVVKMDTSEVFAPLETLRFYIGIILGGLIFLVSIFAFFMGRSVINPLYTLSIVTGKIAQGDLSQRVLLQRKDEFGQLAIAFNLMADEVQRGHLELERRVTERTQELVKEKNSAEQALKLVEQTQNNLVQAEKMAALGQLVSGIAHEINTPLGAISSSAGFIQKFLEQTLLTMPPLFQAFSQEECQEFLAILKQSFQRNVYLLSTKELREKRKILSNLLENRVENTTTVADTLIDIGIYEDVENIIQLLKKEYGYEALEIIYKLSELNKSSRTITIATERTAKIVFALKSYSHQRQSGEKVLTDITQSIETVLTLYANQLKQGIKLVKNYASDLPMIDCYPDELNQVWTNLIHNALHAMNYKGTLSISSEKTSSHLKIQIQDSGVGIDPHYIDKIFDAFFTTKAIGEGTGLGLHIIKKIVDKHQGEISVKSHPGCTIFTVALPIYIE